MNPQSTNPQSAYLPPAPDYALPAPAPVPMPVYPTPAAAPQYVAPPSSVSGKNLLALVSLLTSLIVPTTVVAFIFAAIVSSQGGSDVLVAVAGIILTLSVVLILPGSITAIIAGHVGFHVAKKYSPEDARRGMAIGGLVLGYLGIVVGLLAIATFIIALTL